MFDDQPTGHSAPPANLPTEPADMFAGVEKEDNLSPAAPRALDAGLLKRKSAPTAATPASASALPTDAAPMYTMKEPILGKIFMIILLIVILGGLGFGGWWAYNKFLKNPPVQTPTTSQNNLNTAPIVATSTEQTAATNTTTEIPADISAKMQNDQLLFGEPVDSDKDGLDDVREREIGTDPSNPDTDNDGLSDSDEVIVWKTDPSNPDSDGDSYLDGQEIANGYNPLGAGKLTGSLLTTTTSP